MKSHFIIYIIKKNGDFDMDIVMYEKEICLHCENHENCRHSGNYNDNIKCFIDEYDVKTMKCELYKKRGNTNE